jgi:hypothetical protein
MSLFLPSLFRTARHRWRLLALVAFTSLTRLTAGEFLFVTFKDPGREGIWFAVSPDGYAWTALNHGDPVLRTSPEMGTMRDPFIARGPDGVFHLIWTGGRPGFGYSRSTDLITWSTPRRIPVWPGDSQVRNLWAPEIQFDPDTGRWLIFWSTTRTGDFPATDGLVENGMNHRIYAMDTADFETFSAPRVFFDPGYPVIDATLVPDPAGGWILAYKDERRTPLHKQLRLARGPTMHGPWTPDAGEPLTEPWTEGPSLLQLTEGWLMFYDFYKPARGMQAIYSPDLKSWRPADSTRLRFPPLTKHGAFLPISDAEATRLREALPAASSAN